MGHTQYLSFKMCFFLAQELGLEIVHIESAGFVGLEGFNDLRNWLK